MFTHYLILAYKRIEQSALYFWYFRSFGFLALSLLLLSLLLSVLVSVLMSLGVVCKIV